MMSMYMYLILNTKKALYLIPASTQPSNNHKICLLHNSCLEKGLHGNVYSVPMTMGHILYIQIGQ